MKRHQPRDCDKTRQLLDDFISGELSVESNREILSHLEYCASCGNEQQARQQMRESLRHAWQAQEVPQGLGKRILSGLEAAPGGLHHLRRAAVFVLATLALYLAWQFFPLTASAIDHYYQAVKDHFQCQPVAEDRIQPLPIPITNPRLETVVDSLPGQYFMRTGHLCQAEDVEFFHYEFVSRTSEARFSLVIEARAADETLAQRQELVRQVIASLDVNVLHHDEATLLALQTDSHFVYLVTEAEEPEKVQALAQALLPALDDLL